MLVNCPKCGFSQPEDQYCAQCGIDMRQYEPPKKPLFEKLIKHPLLPVIIIAVGGYAYFRYQEDQKQQSLRSRMEYLTGQSERTQNIASGQASEAQSQIADPQVRDSTTSQETGASAAELEASSDSSRGSFGFQRGQESGAMAQKPAQERAAQKPEEAPVAAKAKPARIPESPIITVVFAEVKNDFLAALASGEEGRNVRDYADFAEQSVSSLKDKLNYGLQNGSITILDRTTKQFQNLNATEQWFSGESTTRATPDAAGINTLMALDGTEAGRLFAELELLVTTPSTNGAIPDTFSSRISIAPGQGSILYGLFIPRQRPKAEQRGRFNQGALKIALSQDFQDDRSQLAIFVFLDPIAPENP